MSYRAAEQEGEREGERGRGSKGEATRRRLLEAAEAIIGERGYYQTSIADITSRAGVAQGTFYLYFESKLAIFRELVRHLSHALRMETEVASQAACHRLEVEKAGIAAFYRFVDRHRNLYRIIRQAEVVDEELFRWYYRRMASGYAKRLAAAMERGEIRRMDPELAAWALMGAVDYTGARFVLWEEESRADAGALVDLLGRGLAPGGGEGG